MTNDTTLTYYERIVNDEYKLAKEFNKYYINIAEKSSATKPVKLEVPGNFV